jgi:hypothetical protein
MTEQCDKGGGGWMPEWDDEFARTLIGRRVLVGITYRRRGDDSIVRLEQVYGVVRAVDRSRGITVVLEGALAGQTRVLPPANNTFEPAPAGTYRLKTTGESVEDPDFTAMWDIFEPAS